MAVNEKHIQRLYLERRSKFAHRDAQGARIRDVLTNNMDLVMRDVVKADEEPVVGNLIWAAARTISQRVGRMPRLDCVPVDQNSEAQLTKADKHEARLKDWHIRMNLPATRLQAAFWLVVHDLAPLIITPSPSYGFPVIEVRDPLTCYPGIIWPHKPEMVDVLFASRMTPWAASALYPEVERIVSSKDEQVEGVVLGEYFTGEGLYVCLLEPSVYLLDFIPNPVPGKSMCVLARGFSPDLDFHGQFDHVAAALVAQAKLFSMVMAYAEQQISAETVVVGEITSNHGQWATGPGAVNSITALPGAQAQKLTNNMSTQIFNELDRLERAIRLGGQFPAQLSGEPVASVATGRGLEQLTLTVDDNVAYWQSVLDDAFMRAYKMFPSLAKAMKAEGWEDLDDSVTPFVRSLSGADPAETVRLLQLQGAKNISRLTIMERLPEVDSPLKELERLDIDDMRTTLIRSLDVQIQNQQLSGDAIAEMIQRRKKGDDIENIWQDVQEIQMRKQQEAQAMAAQQAAGQPPQGPPPPLTPESLVQAAQGQAMRAARTGPIAVQERRALLGGLAPTPGAGVPGGAGIPGA